MAALVKISRFVSELEAALNRKDGYIMGARGQNPRTGYLDLTETKVKSAWEPDGWYYDQYSGSQREQALYWRKHATRVWDCNGMAEGIYELETGVNIDSKARFNYSEWCNPKGDNLSDMPRVPGMAVFIHSASKGYITHVGYLYKPTDDGRDWWVIEARGVMYGVVKTKLSARNWNRWGAMTKYFDYEGALEKIEIDTDGNPFGTRNLKRGCVGEDVRALQETLISLNFSCGVYGADGDFGGATYRAVTEYQAARGLTVDGIVGERTKAALMRDIVESEETHVLTIRGTREFLEPIQAQFGGEIV